MLTDRDLEMLRTERHNDYVAEAAREKAEAIANADAHTNNAGLPTYSELVEALRNLTAWAQLVDVPNSCAPLDREGRHLTAKAAALLARVPT